MNFFLLFFPNSIFCTRFLYIIFLKSNSFFILVINSPVHQKRRHQDTNFTDFLDDAEWFFFFLSYFKIFIHHSGFCSVQYTYIPLVYQQAKYTYITFTLLTFHPQRTLRVALYHFYFLFFILLWNYTILCIIKCVSYIFFTF